MPKSTLHKIKSKKNLITLGAIVVWAVLIWIVTMVKMMGGDAS